jgi:hypothetical protein
MRRTRAWWRMLFIFSVIKVIAFIAVGALVWFALTHPAPNSLDADVAHSASSIVSNVFEVVFLLQMADFLTGMHMVGPAGWNAPTTAYTRALMNAVVARDLNLTQAVTVVPARDNATGAEQPAEPSETPWIVGPLAHPMRTLARNGGVYVVGALAGIVLLGGGVFMTIISLRIPPSFHPPITLANWLSWLALPCCLMLFGLASIVVVLTAWRFERMERQGFSAQVDASGVTFLRAGETGQGRRLRWSDMGGFARFAFTDELGCLHEVFALSSAEQDFLWEALYDSRNAPTTAAGEEAWRVAAHQLTERVVQGAGLPLLDLTPTLSATLAANTGGDAPATWNLLGRARAIARRQGDRAFAHTIAQRQAQSGRLIAWFGARNDGRVRRLSPEQCAKTVQLARELLPYYPTFAQMTPNPRRRLLIQGYWSSELLIQFLVVVFAFANLLSFLYWPFS